VKREACRLPARGGGTGGRFALHASRFTLLLAALLIAVWTAPARAADPLNTMRAFCQADGRGARLDPSRWLDIAGLVTWLLEPAWDHLYLIRGFELGTPHSADGEVEVPVQYTITAEVRSDGVKADERVEARTVRLVRGEGGVWRIRGPAPPPHVFASEADAETLAALLDPESTQYLSNSAFVWRMLRDAGWTIPYADSAALATASDFAPERTAEVGDLALYFDGDQPYHVGIVESDATIISATLNGGIRRTPFGAFAGEIRYRRPIATARATPTAEPRPAQRKQGRRGAR
jgi:hypothetical protein